MPGSKRARQGSQPEEGASRKRARKDAETKPEPKSGGKQESVGKAVKPKARADVGTAVRQYIDALQPAGQRLIASRVHEALEAFQGNGGGILCSIKWGKPHLSVTSISGAQWKNICGGFGPAEEGTGVAFTVGVPEDQAATFATHAKGLQHSTSKYKGYTLYAKTFNAPGDVNTADMQLWLAAAQRGFEASKQIKG